MQKEATVVLLNIYYPGICLEGLRKPAVTSVRIVDLWAEIRTQDFPVGRSANSSAALCCQKVDISPWRWRSSDML